MTLTFSLLRFRNHLNLELRFYCTVKVNVTVAVCCVYATLALLSGLTPTPMKRVSAVPLATPAAPTVSGVALVVLIAVMSAGTAGAVPLVAVVERITTRSWGAAKSVET